MHILSFPFVKFLMGLSVILPTSASLLILSFCMENLFIGQVFNSLLWTIAIPSRNFAILVIVSTYKLNKISSKARCFIQGISQELPFLHFPQLKMFLLYLIVSVLHITAAPSLCSLNLPSNVRILSFCVAFVVLDSSVIFLLLQFLAFGVGATSGHTSIEKISRMAIFHLLAYFFALLVSATAFFGFMVHMLDNATVSNIDLKGGSINGGCSFSCSVRKTNYAERRPVEVSSCLATHVHSSRPIAREGRLKWVTILALCLVYVHRRYMNLYHSAEQDISSSPCYFSKFYTETALNVLNSLIELPCSWHMLLFFLLCALLWYRVRRHAFYRRDLLDLNLQTSVNVKNDNEVSTDSPPSLLVMRMNVISSSNGRPPDSENFSQLYPTEKISESAPPVVISSEHIVDTARCLKFIEQGLGSRLSDSDLLALVSRSLVKTRDLERILQNPFKAVRLRRAAMSELLTNPSSLDNLPYKQYDYRFVYGQCCEEVIGYVPIPVGKIGPMLLDGRSHYIPMATTEGCLVASTNRGCRALFLSGGVKSVVFRDQMTRAPVVRFGSLVQLTECIAWLDSEKGFQTLKNVFDQTSSHINLLSIFPNPAGRYLHIRFAARTGDAMGMNMVSKATNSALYELKHHFPDMQVISLSGNMCTDKKPAMINSLLGRGKSVIAEALLPATVLAQVLHTSATRMARLAHAKNWTGSALAGCTGVSGCNAHAANLIAALFAATGQDLAQVVDSSACLTQLEALPEDDSLLASVTMPCLEVGTVGGGTRLPAQRACLDLIDLSVDRPTEHLARLFASIVLAGELSLLAALDTDDLVTAHLRLNRAKDPVCSGGGGSSRPCADPVVSGSGTEAVMGLTHEHLHAVM